MPVDDPPALAGTTTLSMAEDTSLTLTLANVSVVDPDSPQSAITLQLLPSTQYQSTGNTLRPPLNFNGDLTVTVRLSDGQASATAQFTVTVTPVNDAPFETVPTPKQTDENVAFTFDSSARVRVSDVDAGDSPLLAELSADSGTITLANGAANLTFTTGDGTNDAVLHFSGSQAAINAALDGMVVTPAHNFSGLITLTFSTNDQGATGAGGALSDSETFTLGVGAVDLPPFAQLPADFHLDEDTPHTFSSAITVGDTDLPSGDTMTADISVSSGALTLSGITGLTFSLGTGTSNPHMTFTGTPANINAAFNGMVYTPSQDFAGTVTVTLIVHSGALSDTDTLIITMNAIDDRPSITAVRTTVTTQQNTAFAFTGTSAITVGDVDSSTGDVTLTVTATHGTVAMTAAGAVTFGAPSPAASIVADGVITDLASTIATLSFTPDSDYTGAATIAIVIDDNGNTGSGGPLSANVTITVNVIVPDAPPTAVADTYDTMGNTQLAVTTNGVLADDVVAADVVVTTTGNIATTLGGTAVMNADGTFTYTPPVGHGNIASPEADTFQYTVQNNIAQQSTATVTINLHQVIWYVESDSAAIVPDGSSGSPFVTTTDAAAKAASGSIIYVRDVGSPYGGLEVGAGVTLIGSGVVLTRQPYNADIPATTNAPQLQSGVATVLVMDASSTVRGVDVSSSGDGPIVTSAITATSVHDVTIQSVTIHDHGTGITLSGCSGSMIIDHVTITNMAADGIDVTATTDVTVNRITSPTLSLMNNGIAAIVTDGASLTATIDSVTTTLISQVGVSLTNSSAAATSTIVVRNSDFQNQRAPGPSTGTTAIGVHNAVADSTTQIEVSNTLFSGWATSAVRLFAGSGYANQITASIQGNILGNPFSDSFGGVVFFVSPGDGNADITTNGNSIDNADGVSLEVDSGTVCLDSANDDFAGVADPDFDLSATTMKLVGYNPGSQSLGQYIAAIGDTGTVAGTSTPVAAASCIQVVLP